MGTYSHSRISTYEECPLRYKLTYIDRVRRETEGIEAFLGSRVHDTLQKCYEDARRTRILTLNELLAFYDAAWRKEWHTNVVVSRKDLTADHYRQLGSKLLATYYQRFAPFDSDLTIGTELRLNFPLDDGGHYVINGIIDRLARTPDGTLWVHDYKTGAHLPSQADADADRQLALYQLGVQKRWLDARTVKLVWHHLAHDTDIVSERAPQALGQVAAAVMQTIDEIEAATDFPARETALCAWCDYPDLCPQHKHATMVGDLPPNRFLSEPGVALVNRYAALKQQAGEIEAETEEVRAALIDYARRNGLGVVRGSDRQARVRFHTALKFPGKNDPARGELDAVLQDAGKWEEVSQLDATALAAAIAGRDWDRALIERVMRHGRLEEMTSVHLARVKEGEK